MSKEPILFFVSGGMPLMIGLVHLARAFGLPITEPEEAAIYSLWSIVLGVLARMCVVPVSQLPAGTLDQMQQTKVANAKP